MLAPKNDVEYEDEIPALKREVKKLKHQGVNILIALGHSGFLKDLEIAKYVDDLDLVIGGHSNTFLYNKNSTDETPETVEGPYPTIVTQSSGRIVRVVQAYAYTKYLGKLHLTFDSYGEIVHCDGGPILLNQSVPRDPEVLRIVESYRSSIDKINNLVVGISAVTLHGEYCRLRECNIGDLITDAILNFTKSKGIDVNIAITQGGRIRAAIDRPQKPFEVTRGDWITVLPFSDLSTVLTMNGSVLIEALEHAVENWRRIDSPGQFLQFSGMRVVYDLARPPGLRVVSAKAECSTCNEITDVEDHLVYRVVMCAFLAEGGDGFSMFEGLPNEIFPYSDVDAVFYHINGTGSITQKEDGRLVILNENAVKEPAEAIMTRFMSSSGNIYLPNLISNYLFIVLMIIIQFRY